MNTLSRFYFKSTSNVGTELLTTTENVKKTTKKKTKQRMYAFKVIRELQYIYCSSSFLQTFHTLFFTHRVESKDYIEKRIRY